MTPLVVGVCGAAQAGKDTTVNRLVSRWGYTRYAFADQLKSMALTLDPFILDGDLRSGRYERGYDADAVTRLSTLVAEGGWEDAKKLPEVRRFLQVLGTEGVRDHLGEDSWVHATGKAMLAGGEARVGLSDCRFPNEAEFIQRSCGGVLIRVVRYNADGGRFENGVDQGHPSEKHVASLPADYEIAVLSGDIVGLQLAVDGIAADLEEGFRPSRGPHMPTRAELDDLFATQQTRGGTLRQETDHA